MKHAARAGASGTLQIVPYYNKPTQAGLFDHFRQIARATKLPVVLYNIPGRTGVNMAVETVVKLAESCPTVIGIKEASGTMDYTSQLLAALGQDRFLVLSGDDSLTLPLLSLGARGVISVMANILPAPMSELCASWESGDAERALSIHLELFPLMRALFLETNPIPIKAAMARLGLCRADLRAPLVPMAPEARKKLWAALDACPFIQKGK